MPPTASPGGVGRQQRKHRRIAYRVAIRSFRHTRDTDLIEGVYRDREGSTIGRVLLTDQPHVLSDFCAVITGPPDFIVSRKQESWTTSRS